MGRGPNLGATAALGSEHRLAHAGSTTSVHALNSQSAENGKEWHWLALFRGVPVPSRTVRQRNTSGMGGPVADRLKLLIHWSQCRQLRPVPDPLKRRFPVAVLFDAAEPSAITTSPPSLPDPSLPAMVGVVFQCDTGVLWHAVAVSIQPLKAVRSAEPKREPKGSACRPTRVGYFASFASFVSPPLGATTYE